ncbi:MAG: c-type cytochrome [Actinomycetota bacterium]
MSRQAGAIKTWIALFVVLAGGGIALLAGVGCVIKANACPFHKSAPQTSTDGATLFLVNCAVCHGRNGEGGKGPSLVAGDAALLSHSDLLSKITHGKPLAGMPMFEGRLTTLQIKAVASFLESLRAKGST